MENKDTICHDGCVLPPLTEELCWEFKLLGITGQGSAVVLRLCSGSVFWLPMNICATVRTEQLLKWFYCSPERIPLQQKHAYSLYVPECSELLKSLDQMVKNRGFPLLLLVEDALATSCRKQRNPVDEKFYKVKMSQGLRI